MSNRQLLLQPQIISNRHDLKQISRADNSAAIEAGASMLPA
jgi:hypothetical protein